MSQSTDAVLAIPVGAYFGFKASIFSTAAAFALGPRGSKTFLVAPPALAFLPCAYGVFSLGISFALKKPSDEKWLEFGYILGSFAGGSLLKKPKILIPLAVLASARQLASS
ncbi:hypothetical protein ISTM_419 [Insectomime virus]|uniref:Uncharacterized protein n=1 Tax=Tunisvirus fontaine2 TaxID=1421067 RepID=V9SEF8_9VIRU|nr:hypothetical protein D1R32_gp383 [Tunisvirus fontaine2]AHA46317.1 hypothetical protein ISTM_419 [Insectomime virus]AHC55100.1 hypothetical protein TNS_ORF382 [Tunisvirus fontaine2]